MFKIEGTVDMSTRSTSNKNVVTFYLNTAIFKETLVIIKLIGSKYDADILWFCL